MKRRVFYAIAATIGLGLGLGAVVVVEPRLPTSPLIRGLTIDGRAAPIGRGGHEEPVRGWLEQRSREIGEGRVTLRHGEHRFEATLAELGVSIDIPATLRAAREVGHRGSAVRRLRETAAARRGEVDIPLAWKFDKDAAQLHLQKYAAQLQREPVDARLDLEAHQNVPDQPGAELDLEASFVALREQAFGAQVDLVTRTVPAKVTMASLDQIDVSKVLSSFETKYAVFKVGRSANIVLASSRINGLILQPQQMMSFNDRVGKRSRENGFQEAPEIQGDELTTGIGGGTCQVSGTLFGAAVHGGLDVVERRSHTRPSDYTQLGLDATVSYGAVDLKLRNPHRFPIAIHAFAPQPGVLRVELLGGEAVASVEYKYGVGSIENYERRITVKSFLKEGRFFRHQRGTRGMDVQSYAVIKFLDGRSEARQWYSGYKATPEVFWVASDYEEGKLPPLPEHAKGVEGRLAQSESDVYPEG